MSAGRAAESPKSDTLSYRRNALEGTERTIYRRRKKDVYKRQAFAAAKGIGYVAGGLKSTFGQPG